MKNYKILKLDERVKGKEELRITINTPLPQVENLINSLKEEVEKDKAEFEVLKNICFDLISRLPLPIHQFDNAFILRSRPNFNGEVFSRTTEISYNQNIDKIKLNRFNLKGEPAFYGAAPVSAQKCRWSSYHNLRVLQRFV